MSQFIVNKRMMEMDTENGNHIWIRNMPIKLATKLAIEEGKVTADLTSGKRSILTGQDSDAYSALIIEVLKAVIKDENGKPFMGPALDDEGVQKRTNDNEPIIEDKTSELIDTLWDIDINEIVSIAKGNDPQHIQIAKMAQLKNKVEELSKAEKKS